MDEKWLEQAKRLAKRPYYIRVNLDETTENKPIYLAHVPELEGCFGQGDNPKSAVADLKNAMVDYIASILEDGLPVPEPTEFFNTSSSTISKTFTVTNYTVDQIIVSNPHRNVYVSGG